jgi:hypothetical protein
MGILHPEGRKLPDDHPLRPGAPMMILSVRKAPSTTSTEKPSEDSSESPKPEQSSEPKPDQS